MFAQGCSQVDTINLLINKRTTNEVSLKRGSGFGYVTHVLTYSLKITVLFSGSARRFEHLSLCIWSRAGQIFEIFKCLKFFKKYLKNVSDPGNI